MYTDAVLPIAFLRLSVPSACNFITFFIARAVRNIPSVPAAKDINRLNE
jgi:hypothetical protein